MTFGNAIPDKQVSSSKKACLGKQASPTKLLHKHPNKGSFRLNIFPMVLFLITFHFSNGLSASSSIQTPHEICALMAVNPSETASINDVSLLNETRISCVIAPQNSEQISDVLRSVNEWNKTQPNVHVSVAGARHSQGGHIASKNGIVLDMRQLNAVDAPQKNNELWTVKAQAGALWSDVHDAIRLNNGTSLANKVQQSSTPFTVGGTLSVNAHGRNFSYGSVLHSVEKITLVLPDGNIINASRAENPEIFKQAIGGYGLFGVITDVTLELHENHTLSVESTVFNTPNEYIKALIHTLENTPKHTVERNESGALVSENLASIAYLFAVLSLEEDEFLSKGRSYIYRQHSTLDNTGFINPDPKPNLLNIKSLATKIGFGLKRKSYIVSMAQKIQHDFLMKQDSRLEVLTPPIEPILAASSNKKPDLLQEYFIPVEQMPEFIAHVKAIFLNNGVVLSNASLRFIPKAQESSLLTYESPTNDQLALVLYFSLDMNEKAMADAQLWTRSLVDKSIELKGRYYLPYQQWPSREQFQTAYPTYKEFQANKIASDPNNVLSNKFYQYYLN